jgi:UDP-N-acetylmuramoylalanine--D-glutamate ligase
MKDYRKTIPALAVDKPRCLVLGAGKSGLAAIRILQSIGADAALVDSCPPRDGAPAGCTLVAPCERLPDGHFDLCVASPAIPMGHTWLAQCAERAIPVISEMELGYAFWQGRILAVTGSKGKSSIVKLCAETLTAAGHRAIPCGNYGTPLCDVALDEPDAEWAIAETSSFQLEHTVAFRPDAAILLNLQADHLDRHASMEEYARMKFRLFERQDNDCMAFLPEGLDSFGQPLPANVPVQFFGASSEADWRYSPGHVVGHLREHEVSVDFAGTWFDNPVLGIAAASVVGALSFCGLTSAEIASGLAAFKPLPHRMQHVADRNGVLFIDDSKATSLAATAAALSMVFRPIRLIAGGRLKEKKVDFIKVLLTKRVKKVYLIGECENVLFASWQDAVACVECHFLEKAVQAAATDSVAGDVVLLSPGCASFDQFVSYGKRGEQFALLAKSVAISHADTMEEK